MNLSALNEAIERGDIKTVTEGLRAHPELAMAKTPDLDTTLHIACWQKQLAIVEVILSLRPDVNARGRYGRTPLHYAVHEGRAVTIPIVQRLIESGADPAIRDENGFSVEAWARSEMWEGLDSVIALIGGTPTSAPGVPTDFASVEAKVRDLEKRNHTAVGLSRMLEAYFSGNGVDPKRVIDGLVAADTTCLEDAARILLMLDATTWGLPLRQWLRETLKPAQVLGLMERYEFDGKRNPTS